MELQFWQVRSEKFVLLVQCKIGVGTVPRRRLITNQNHIPAGVPGLIFVCRRGVFCEGSGTVWQIFQCIRGGRLYRASWQLIWGHGNYLMDLTSKFQKLWGCDWRVLSLREVGGLATGNPRAKEKMTWYLGSAPKLIVSNPHWNKNNGDNTCAHIRAEALKRELLPKGSVWWWSLGLQNRESE